MTKQLKTAALVFTFLSQAIALPGAAFASNAGPLRVSLDKLSGFSSTSNEKVAQAAQVMERVMNSEEFRQKVLAFQYNGQAQFSNNDLTRNDGTVESNLTNEQIYQAIMDGAEQLKGQTAVDDHVANLDLVLYTPPWYKKWSVVGYGNPGQPEIFMNSYYFNSFTLADIAGNMAHEWCHKIGFDHDFNRTSRRPYSVPYAIGDLVVKLGAAAALN